jgi:hypothetical protein
MELALGLARGAGVRRLFGLEGKAALDTAPRGLGALLVHDIVFPFLSIKAFSSVAAAGVPVSICAGPDHFSWSLGWGGRARP